MASTNSNIQQASAEAKSDQAAEEDKIRLAVLGGGPSSLTALYYITSTPELRAKYDITLYQMGWRLGGKGASGRAEHGRILEHGLHVLFGFYDNFFSMIRAAYKELGRPSTHPLATWTDAFKPGDFGVVEEFFQDEWQPWPLQFPTNQSVPGEAEVWDTPEDYLQMAIEALIELIFGWRALHNLEERSTIFNAHGHNEHQPSWRDSIVNGGLRLLLWPLQWAKKHTNPKWRDRCIVNIIGFFQKLLWPLIQRLSNKSFAAHKFWLGIDFLMALIKGVVKDGVYKKGGFDAIDDYDFREWLTMHGLHAITLPSPFCRIIYDAAFSYENGDPETQRIAAGAGLRALFRLGFTYKGSPFYKMQAGMGDTVFTPLYDVLKARGVKFKFFHKVESLQLSPETTDGSERSIASIKVTQQAFMQDGSDISNYAPLEDVVDLECWPAKPLYPQLANADELNKHDLESYYDQLPDSLKKPVTLEQGKDYDEVLFGIPIGAVPYVCEELVNSSDKWKTMVEHVRSVTTVTFQLWFNKDLKDLGWELPSPLLSLYVEPLNTWADMSQVIDREAWPPNLGPKNISYYCGAQEGPEWAPDPRLAENANFEIEQYAEAKKLALQYCTNSLTTLLPKASIDGDLKKVDWNVLLDLQNAEGPARFDSQYWRSNCGPSERCTLAMPGATKHRIKAGETDFSNLSVTGDWIWNGLFVACMEGAITSGIYGARAVTGVDFMIIGEELDSM